MRVQAGETPQADECEEAGVASAPGPTERTPTRQLHDAAAVASCGWFVPGRAETCLCRRSHRSRPRSPVVRLVKQFVESGARQEWLRHQDHRRNKRPATTHGERKAVWRRFGTWLLLGLEFELAPDIIGSVISPTWQDIGELGAIAVIRTFLNYFLEKDLERTETGG